MTFALEIPCMHAAHGRYFRECLLVLPRPGKRVLHHSLRICTSAMTILGTTTAYHLYFQPRSCPHLERSP